MTVKKALTGLVMVVVVLAGVWVYRQFKGQEKAIEDLKKADAQSQATIKDLDADKKALQTANAQIQTVITAKDQAITEIEGRLEKTKQDLQTALDKIAQASPAELLEALRLRIDLGIRIQNNAVLDPEFVFSLGAARRTAEIAEEWHSLKFSTVPDLNKKIDEQKGIIAGKDATIANDQKIFLDDGKIISEKDKQIKDRDDLLKKVTKNRLKRDLVSGGIGAGIMAVLALLFGK